MGWAVPRRRRTRVGRQRDDGVARDGQVALGGGAVVREHGIYQAKQLHHALVLPQVLVALHGARGRVSGARGRVSGAPPKRHARALVRSSCRGSS